MEAYEFPADAGAVDALACTLSPDALQQRARDWVVLRRHHMIDRRIRGQTIESRWRVEGLSELRRLIAAERECCPFLGFRLVVDGQVARLETKVPTGVGPHMFDDVG